MPAINSLEDLNRAREQILQTRKSKASSGHVQVIVSLGSCGIAAGANDTMKRILNFIESERMNNVTVTKAGCIGLCEHEPILQIIMGDQPKVTYGKVSVQVAEKIMIEHVQYGQPVKENLIHK